MTKAEKIRFWYGIFLTVFTVVIGALFIMQAAVIYYGGADATGATYSRALVGKKLKEILVPVILWGVAVIAGFVLFVIYPVERKERVKSSERATVNRLKGRLTGSVIEGEELRTYKKWETARLIAMLVSGAFCILAAVMCAVYLLKTANFPAENINSEILKMLKNVLPWVGCAFALCIGTVFFDRYCATRQLPAVKRMLALKQGLPASALSKAEKGYLAAEAALSKPYVIWGIRIALFVLGVSFVIWGVFNGGAKDVLDKAIKICSECIGLG